ncbi:hypothetical protein MT418_008169 [Batrachochytrium dendrobatidis]
MGDLWDHHEPTHSAPSIDNNWLIGLQTLGLKIDTPSTLLASVRGLTFGGGVHHLQRLMWSVSPYSTVRVIDGILLLG